jgi:HPt (histidine-containing phosphotransfer) domain-containing protein
MFFNNGFNDFISKPIDADELRKVVKRNLPHGKIRETDSKSLESHSKIEDELFRKSIVTFVKDNRDTYRKITDALDADDDKTAHRIAHTLKSNAAYLKKTNLSEAAASLEASLSKKPPRHTDGQLLEIETELNKALAEFSKVLEETEAREPESVQLSAEELAGLFAELKPLLEKSDFGATEYAERLKGVEGLEKLAELIDEYDFHGALELLESTG